MSFWMGKNETLLQSIVEISYKAFLTGIVIVVFSRFLIAEIDRQIEVTSKRDALNTFRNVRLSSLTHEFTAAYLALECARELQTVKTEGCRSKMASFLTKLNAIFLELKVHFPDEVFPELLKLKGKAESIYAMPPQMSQSDIDGFAASFGTALDEMAENFR